MSYLENEANFIFFAGCLEKSNDRNKIPSITYKYLEGKYNFAFLLEILPLTFLHTHV